MANTSEPFVARMREIIGCGSTVFRADRHLKATPKGHQGSKPMYHYSLKGSLRCYKVLTQVEHFLIIKRELALGIIQDLQDRPFGRMANQELGARALAAEVKRQWWANLSPEDRAKVKENMRRARWG